jgi:hypothetical protein
MLGGSDLTKDYQMSLSFWGYPLMKLIGQLRIEKASWMIFV